MWNEGSKGVSLHAYTRGMRGAEGGSLHMREGLGTQPTMHTGLFVHTAQMSAHCMHESPPPSTYTCDEPPTP